MEAWKYYLFSTVYADKWWLCSGWGVSCVAVLALLVLPLSRVWVSFIPKHNPPKTPGIPMIKWFSSSKERIGRFKESQ